jgi:hypothetical protein
MGEASMEVLIQAKGNPARTKTVPQRDAKILVRLGRWEYPTTALEAGPPAAVEPELDIPDPEPEEPEAEPASKPAKAKATKAGRRPGKK